MCFGGSHDSELPSGTRKTRDRYLSHAEFFFETHLKITIDILYQHD